MNKCIVMNAKKEVIFLGLWVPHAGSAKEKITVNPDTLSAREISTNDNPITIHLWTGEKFERQIICTKLEAYVDRTPLIQYVFDFA